MIIARWKIDARFGHKSEVTDAMQWWMNEIAPELGWNSDKTRMMTGAIGANESAVVMEVKLDSITELDGSWNKLRNMDRHREWGKDLEPNVVSGSHRWEVYRLD